MIEKLQEKMYAADKIRLFLLFILSHLQVIYHHIVFIFHHSPSEGF